MRVMINIHIQMPATVSRRSSGLEQKIVKGQMDEGEKKTAAERDLVFGFCFFLGGGFKYVLFSSLFEGK